MLKEVVHNNHVVLNDMLKSVNRISRSRCTFDHYTAVSYSVCLNVRIVNRAQNVNAYLNYIIAAPDSAKAGTRLQWLEDSATCCTCPRTYREVGE
jgi:hypothetical protein